MFPLIICRKYICGPFVDNYFIDIFDQENDISMGSCFSSTYSAIPLEYLQVKRYQPPARESPHFHPNCGSLWESPGWFWKKVKFFIPPKKNCTKNKRHNPGDSKWSFFIPIVGGHLTVQKGQNNNPQKGHQLAVHCPDAVLPKTRPLSTCFLRRMFSREKSKKLEVCGFRSHLLDHHQFSTLVLEGENTPCGVKCVAMGNKP